MTAITRRGALTGAGAAAVVGLPTALDPMAREVSEVFRQLNPERRKCLLPLMRSILRIQRHHERMGLTEADVQAALDRQMRGARS